MTRPARAKALPHTDAPRPAPGIALPTPTGGRPTKTERPQRLPQREPHPITIMSPTCHPARSRTEISMGARAHEERQPPAPQPLTTNNPDPALDRRDPAQISRSGLVLTPIPPGHHGDFPEYPVPASKASSAVSRWPQFRRSGAGWSCAVRSRSADRLSGPIRRVRGAKWSLESSVRSSRRATGTESWSGERAHLARTGLAAVRNL